MKNDQPKHDDSNKLWLSVINVSALKKAGLLGIGLSLAFFSAKALFEDSTKKILAPVGTQIADFAHARWDDIWCGGHTAMLEGDRLTGLATKDLARAQGTFEQANAHYEKAYACGFPDAGIRLALAHCMGFGTPKDARKARRIVIEIEGKHESRRGRASDVRKACGL